MGQEIIRTAQLVEQLQILFDLVGITIEEFPFVHRSIRAARAGSAVVGAIKNQGVVQWSRLFQVIDNSANRASVYSEKPA